MAWNIEVKHAFRELEERVKKLEDAAKVPTFSTQPNPEVLQEMVKPKTRMCPKCGEKPGYFFHVRSCSGKKQKQNDGLRTPDTPK